MKFITAIVAFSVTFGFSAFTAQLLGANNQLNFRAAENNRTAQEISFFLEQDIANGEEMDEICQSTDSFSEYSVAVNQYVTASESIEDVNLPPDFRFVWQAHMNAWRRHADFLKSSSYPREIISKNQFSRTFTRQDDEIKSTWLTVLNVARKYDAVIPPNAY